MALLPETRKRGTGAREFVNNFRLYLTVSNCIQLSNMLQSYCMLI